MLKALVRSSIIWGVYGFPGFWLYGAPTMLVYGALKLSFALWRDGYEQLINRIKRIIPQGRDDLLAEGRQWAIENPELIAKGILSFFSLFLVSMPWSFLAIYGLYRFSIREWFTLLQKKAEWIYNRFNRLFSALTQGVHFHQKLLILFGLTALVGAPFFYLIGVVGLVDLTFIAITTLMVSVGASVFLRDIRYAIRHPIQTGSEHSGKILGGILGRRTAFLISHGEVVGSLGVAVGEVHSQGFLSRLVPSFLYPSGEKFILGNGLSGLLISRMSAFFNSIYTSIFFSHNMQLHGDFYGVIGPTQFQIFLFTGVGALLGYGVERMVDQLIDTVTEDARNVTRCVKNKVVGLVRAPAAAPIVHAFQQRQQLTLPRPSTPLRPDEHAPRSVRPS